MPLYAATAAAAVNEAQPPGVYNNGEFFVNSSSLALKLGAISGYDGATSLVSYNGSSVSPTAENTIFGAGAAAGNTANLPGGSVVNPFKLAIKKSGGWSPTFTNERWSTKDSDNPTGIKAAKVFKINNGFLSSKTAGQDVLDDSGRILKTSIVVEGDYLLGFEDVPDGTGDFPRPGWKGDYNDFILTATLTPIPEPAFYQMSGLLVAGGLGMLRLRRKKNK